MSRLAALADAALAEIDAWEVRFKFSDGKNGPTERVRAAIAALRDALEVQA